MVHKSIFALVAMRFFIFVTITGEFQSTGIPLECHLGLIKILYFNFPCTTPMLVLVRRVWLATDLAELRGG
jgi:hypothetical protein